jgi:hypothetical protein
MKDGTKPGKFGGANYQPKGLGAEPAAVPPPEGVHAAPHSLDAASLAGVMVPFSSRISLAASQQLKALARQGHSQTDLLAEALTLLFEKHAKDRVV